MSTYRDIPFDTPFGPVMLSVTERDHVYVGFRGQWNQPKITVNGALVHGAVHFFRQADGTFTCDQAAVGRAGLAIDADNARGKPISEAGRRKLREVLTPLINAWARKNGARFEEAHRVKVARERESIERDIAELTKQLQAKYVELLALEA